MPWLRSLDPGPASPGQGRTAGGRRHRLHWTGLQPPGRRWRKRALHGPDGRIVAQARRQTMEEGAFEADTAERFEIGITQCLTVDESGSTSD